MTSMTAPADCRDCGACCAVYVVDLKHGDYARLPTPRRNLLTQQGWLGGWQMRIASGEISGGGGRCAALVGKVGERVRCSVYECRPNVCQSFDRDHIDCRAAIARATEAGVMGNP